MVGESSTTEPCSSLAYLYYLMAPSSKLPRMPLGRTAVRGQRCEAWMQMKGMQQRERGMTSKKQKLQDRGCKRKACVQQGIHMRRM